MSSNISHERARRVSTILIELGWMRWLPHEGTRLVAVLGHDRPMTREELDTQYRGIHADGVDGPCWEPVDLTTAEELAEDPGSEGETIEEVNASEQEMYDKKTAVVNAAAAKHGLGPVRTISDVLDFGVAVGILTLVDGRYDLAADAPLPAEALPLSDEDRQAEDEVRWHMLHEGVGFAIIRLFGPEEQQVVTMRTSLDRLAKQVDADSESVRQGVLGLMTEGDFTANRDIATVQGHQVFELTVDWDAFNEGRLVIRGGGDPQE